jgi:hypothetical protein
MNMLDDVEYQLAKLALGPSEILAVRASHPITAVVAAELRAQLERRLGLQGRILILDAGAELTVVAKSDVADGWRAKPAAAGWPRFPRQHRASAGQGPPLTSSRADR